MLVNEKSATVANLWDGVNLKCTFRRCVDNRLMNLWIEIKNMKARRQGGLPGCPRMFHLVGALDRNSTTQMKRVTTSLPLCIRQWIDEASGRIQ